MTTVMLSLIIYTFFTTSVLMENITFQFISATSKFQYAVVHPDYYKYALHMVNLQDSLLMVAVAKNCIVGPAQLEIRRVESPFEQNVVVTDIEYSPIKNNTVQKTIMDKFGIMKTNPNYGLLTLSSNFLYKKLNTEKYFNIKEYPTAKIVKNFKVLIGDSLAAVTLFKGKIEKRMVKVLPFSSCENVFDPARLFTLDSDEQICTEAVENRKFKSPQTIPSSLLFGKTEEHGYVFVGITSRTRARVSVSTFVPYHCEFLFESLNQQICI